MLVFRYPKFPIVFQIENVLKKKKFSSIQKYIFRKILIICVIEMYSPSISK